MTRRLAVVLHNRGNPKYFHRQRHPAWCNVTLPETDRTRQIFAVARDLARQWGDDTVMPEHVLAALSRSGEGVAGAVLHTMHVDSVALEQDLANQRSPRVSHGPGPDIGFSQRTVALLDAAALEAKAMHQAYVGSEHLLLAILREDIGPAAMTLAACRVEYETACDVTRQLLGMAPRP